MTATLPVYTKKDFQTDQEVRWCPGCGDYAILSAVQSVFPELGVPREKFVVVSGIGCSSRFPYYMNTYGFHTIHGRAPAVATGVKIANPDLEVWVATGDGDALSIGGNHTIHMLRRNVGVKVLLFNNRIYGLTKGQYSPTSELGKKAKSTPFGSVDRPFHPLSLALGVEATKQKRRVLFTRAADLVRQLLEARDARELTRLQQRLRRVEVLIIDELGFVPFERAGGELLFNLITDRYERRATVVTTNLAFAEWVTVFAGDEKLTTALLDRLAHHATVITTKGKSYRMRKRRGTA